MNKRIQIGIGAISLFFIFVYPFLLLPYGLDYTDNFYYATAFAGQTQGNVMIFFFSLPGQVWRAFAPHTVLSLRVLGTLLWIALHLLPIGIVLRTFGLDRGPTYYWTFLQNLWFFAEKNVRMYSIKVCKSRHLAVRMARPSRKMETWRHLNPSL